MQFNQDFHNRLIKELDTYLADQKKRFPTEDTLTIDLHCHDHNSNVPDEILGRILRVPETWLPTEQLMETLKTHGCDTFTVTNHNNARSCYELRDTGHDVVTGAEFSCTVPDFKVGIHVLTYGFTPNQETELEKLRRDIYRFQEYTFENDIPTIWAHPLYHYKTRGLPPMEFFEKMALIFERFEAINGQRDTWQDMLVKTWVETLTPERIDELAKKHRVAPDRYCRDPYKKSLSGGSDSHMGIFAGLTGTRLHVPDLKEKLKILSRSKLALEAIKKGDMAPFGSHNDFERMAVSFMDYFCQIGLNMEDPGLLRMLLHKGDASDKVLAFAISNSFMELKRHKVTINFLKIFHECFSGRVPGFAKRFMVPRAYKDVFSEATKMAEMRRDNPDKTAKAFDASIRKIYANLNHVLFSRLETKIADLDRTDNLLQKDLNGLIDHFELPVSIRGILDHKKSGEGNGKHMSSIDFSSFLDGLSFPSLASGVILGSYFASTKVLYNSRPLLTQFSEELGAFRHPSRMLWLTDTFEDNNGVAMVLKSMLEEIRRRDLPIDLLVCSSTLKGGDHLIVIPPVSEFRIPFYENQPFRVPNLLDIHGIFKQGEYDRVMCSTEGPMGLAALFLKNAFTVPAHFYVHTDWMMFARQVLNFDQQNTDRLRRLIRAFYRGFDGLFVLNTDQRKWLTGGSMGFDESRVFLTAHWAEEIFSPRKAKKKDLYGVSESEPVLLFAGRVSEEKGVMELPYIYDRVKSMHPGVKIAIAGTGPAEKKLKEALPDGIFLGWVDHDRLPEYYSTADMLLLPSKFDTFGCVVLEALSCGCPVAAYRTKGPKDIILDEVNGFVVNNRSEMAAQINSFLKDKKRIQSFKRASLKRSRDYDADLIMERLLSDLDMTA